jgi:hypothetical protein
MSILFRFISLLLLAVAMLAIGMTLMIVNADAQENKSNNGTPAGAKSFVAPSPNGGGAAPTGGDKVKTGGDGIGRPRQIVVEDARAPGKKIEVAKKFEFVAPPKVKSLPAPKPVPSETTTVSAPETPAADTETPVAETETPAPVPAPKPKTVEAAPRPTLTSDSYHSAFRHSSFGHAYSYADYGYSDDGYGYSDDYGGCE